ncbi:DUF3987 domain-containing protein [Bacteroides oleiciplenus]|uniref:DUF3987 domain-containing protein n=1 Tax=Bacteroides oleiciplenus TaxID=626931 RepID=UPI0026DB173F|nr:DUF3987 domain-containing protein [Bacteroides oleiciplenus]
MEPLSSLHLLTEAVRNAGADIAPSYQEYIQLAFAVATDCGEAGRADFLALCSLSPKYDRQAADKLFSNALKTGRNDVHIGTAFHLAELCGVKIQAEISGPVGTVGTEVHPPSGTHTRTRVKEVYPQENNESPCEEDTSSGSAPLSPLPTFDKHIRWPYPLERIMSCASSDAQRDILLLGAFTTLGSTMGWHVRCAYGGKMISPCLQTFVSALSASGKGVLSLVRLLVEPFHDEIRKEALEKMACYLREKAKYDALGKERAKAEVPVMPPNKMFLISGNNTGTGILQNLMDSDGTGLICESEADTISSAIGSDYGHWSDTLRKAFDHDRLAYNRRTDREYREVKKTYLSVLVSGTPSQVKSLIPSAENGLFSRKIFYYMPAIQHWQDQFDRNDRDLEETFIQMGMEWKEKLKTIFMGGIFTLHLSDGQKEEFNRLFSQLFTRSEVTNGNEMSGSIARLAINICRIMEVVAMLRVLESGDIATSPHLSPDPGTSADNLKDHIISLWNLAITDEDFHAVLSMAECLYRHATHILSFLPATEVTRRSNADRDALMECMERQFTRTEFLKKAEEMGIKPATAATWLKRMTKNGLVENKDGKGTYQKP